MSIILREEYYVRYTSHLGNTHSRFSSKIFTSKAEAENFAKSMASLGAEDIEVKELKYYYETGSNK
ncbi:MAG: hypothetical protein J6Y02_19565 [Pseudobutyrivibrio sp.]|nr:hypothetical protein [Pseudobutyrivibrio sp.]